MILRRVGFTLLEVIIALGILAGALVVLVDNQAIAVLATQEADRLTLATNLAQEKKKLMSSTLKQHTGCTKICKHKITANIFFST